MLKAKQNRRFQAEMVGILSLFTFLTVHFRTLGPSDPLRERLRKVIHSVKFKFS